jgi:hypothetical protein
MSDHVCFGGPYHLNSIVGVTDVHNTDNICILKQVQYFRFTHLILNSSTPLMPATLVARFQYIE